MPKRLIVIVAVAWALTLGWPAAAQTPEPLLNHPRQVYLERGTDGAADVLRFVDLITGETLSTSVDGDRYTLLTNGVLYYELAARRVRVIRPDGTNALHPHMQPTAATRRLDWIISADRRTLAWTVTEGEPTALTTTTYLSVDGDEPRLIHTDGPHDGFRAFPVAFSPDTSIVYMDYQPDTIADLLPLRLYAALFSIDLANGQTRSLPGEAGCFCGAALHHGQFIRLTVSDAGGFGLRAIDLATLSQRVSLPITTTHPELIDFGQAGDLLIAPDGTRAVYTLLRIHAAATPDRALETAVIAVDLTAMTQRLLVPPTFDRTRIIGWTDEQSHVLVTIDGQPGTYQLPFSGGAPVQVAEGELLGTLTPMLSAPINAASLAPSESGT